MSNTIDSKVVEMRFDNRNFEQNVKTSLSTIDKLKQKLNFKDAGKSIEAINQSVKKVDMTQLGNSVEKVGLQFDAMYTMADQALRNITNAAMRAGKQIVSALTIDPIKTGFQEYETQINAVQTILANTQSKGTTLNDVNAALDQLNKYADMTIYNFTEMTRNIGTFTAAGVDLDTSVNAIQGIANLAAVSGSNAQQASTAMYQLSQALAAGTVKLMDWNSVVNAGMGGQVFQDALKETARIHGVAIDQMIADQGSFRETLKDGWLTSEILTETLQKFTLTTEGLTEAQIAENREMLKAKGYTDDQIDAIFELGKTATDAATKVKTFTQLWDVLKEAAQSGWTQTWELIFGDFEQAKALFTPISDFLTGIINGISEARNTLLKGALSSPLGQLAEKIANVTAPVTEATDKLKDFSDVVSSVIGGNYGNGESRFAKLTEEGYNWMHIQNLVNEKLGDSTRYVTELEEAQGELTETVLELTDAQLKEVGLTDEEIKMYRDLEKQAKKSGKSVNEMIQEMDQLDGRTMLINSFKNAGTGLVKICKAIRDAWVDAFPPMTSNQLYNIISAIHDFSKKLAMSDETAEKLTRTLKGLFAALDIILTVIGAPIKLALKAIGALLSGMDLDILSVTAAIGDVIVAFRDFLFENNIIIKGLTKLGELIAAVVKAFLKLDIVQNTIQKIKDGFANISSIGQDIIDGLIQGLQNGTVSIGQAMLNIGRTILDTIKSFLGIHSPSTKMIEIGENIIQGLVNGISIGIDAVLAVIKAIGSKIVEFFKGINIQPALDFIKGGFEKLVDFFKGINWGQIIAVASILGVFVILKKIGDALSTLAAPFEAFADIGEGVGRVLKSTSKAINAFKNKMNAEALKTLAIAIGILVGSLVVLVGVMKDNNVWEAVGVIAALAGILVVLSVAVGKFSAGGTVNTMAIAAVMISLGLSLLMISNVVKQMAGLSPEGVGQGILVVGALMVFMGILIKFVALSGGAIKAAGTILAISISVGLLAGLMVLIGFLDPSTIEKGLVVIGALMAFLGMFIVGISMYGGQVVKVGGTLLAIAVSIGILVGVMALIGFLEPSTIQKGAIVIGGLMTFLGLFIVGISKFAPQAPKVAATLFGIAVAIGILVGVMALIGLLEPATITKGLVVIGLLMTFLGLFIVGISKFAPQAPKVAATLLALSVSIGILALVTAMLGIIPVDILAKGTAAVAVLGIIMAGMIKATQGAKNCKGAIMMMAVAIGIMAAAVIALSFIPFEKLAPAVVGMALLMGMFALMESVAGRAKKSQAAILVMTVAVAALAGLIYLLAQLPSGAAIQASIALSILLAVVSGCMVILGKVGKNASQAMASVFVLLALAVPLLAFVGILALMQGMDIALNNVIALGVLVIALSIALIPLSLAGKNAAGALVGVVALLAMALPLLAFVGILALMQNVQNATSNVIALSILVGALTLALIPLTLVGTFAVSALLGVVALLALCVPLLALVGILYVMEGLEDSIKNTVILTRLMDSLSNMMIVLAVTGPLALIGVAAAYALIGLLTVMGTLVVAVGALVETFPQIESFIDTGIPILEKLAHGIGSIVGNLIAGFATAVASGLPEIAIQLSLFMTNLMPFILGAKMIDEDVVSSVTSLVDCFKALAGLSIIESISSWLTGESSVDTFSKQLPALAQGLSSFASEIGVFDESTVATVTCASQALEALANAASNLPNSGGLLGAIMGENDADTFGTMLPMLATGIVAFAAAASGIDASKKDSITLACDCLKLIAEAAKELPNSGGLLGSILGDNNADDFGDMLPKLGEGIAGFVTGLGEFGEDQKTAVQNGCDALTALASAAEEIPNSGGWLGKLIGDDDIGSFGKKLGPLGKAIKDFADGVGDAKTSDINNGVKCLNVLIKLANVDFDVSLDGIEDFNDLIPEVAKAVKSFSDKLSKVKADKVTDAVDKVKKAISSISSISEEDIKKLSSVSDSFKTLGENGIKAITGSFTSDTAKESITTALNTLLSGIKDSQTGEGSSNVESFKTIGKSLAGAIGDGFEAEEQTITDAVDTVIGAVATAVGTVDNWNRFKSIGEYLVSGLVAGINAKKADAVAAARQMAAEVEAAAKTQFAEASPSKKFIAIGKFVAMGLANGITKNTKLASKSSTKMGSAVLTAFQKRLKINSPSLVMNEQGQWIVEGIAEGIESNMSAEEAAEKKAQNIIDAFSEKFEEADLGYDLVMKRYEVWEKDAGYSLSDTEKGTMKTKYLQEALPYRQDAEKLALDQWQNTIQATGADSKQSKEAEITYLDKKGAVLDVVNEMKDIGKDAAKKVEKDPYIVKNMQQTGSKLGEYIAKGISKGITEDMSPEKAAKQKADNIASAFQDAMDKNSTLIDITKDELEIWKLGDGKFASKAEIDSKDIEYLTNELAFTTLNKNLAYDAWLQTVSEFGEDSEHAKTAWKEYYKWVKDVTTIQNSINDVIKGSEDRSIQTSLDGVDNLQSVQELWFKKAGKKASIDEKTARLLSDNASTVTMLTSAYDKAVAAHEKAVQTYAGDSDEVKNAYDQVINIENQLLDAYANEYAILNSTIEAKRNLLDLESESKDATLDLWLKTEGKAASDIVKDAKQAANLRHEILILRDQLTLDQEAYTLAVQEYGEQSEQALSALNKITDTEIAIADAEEGIGQIVKDALQRKIDVANQLISITDKEHQLWEEQNKHRNVSDAKKDEEAISTLKSNLNRLKGNVTRTNKAWKDAIEEFGENSQEARDAYEAYLDAKIAVEQTKNEILDIEEDAKKREIERLKKQNELASQTADLLYSIWEKTEGRKAGSVAKDIRKLATLSEQLTYESEQLKIAQDEWAEAKKEYGEISNEAQEAYNKYLQKQLDIAELQNDIIDLNEKSIERQKRANSQYQDYVDKYEKFYLMNGMTREDLERDAKLVSGWDPNGTVTNIVDKTNEALKDLKSSSEYTEMISEFSSLGSSYVTAIDEGVNDSITAITTSITTTMKTCLDKLEEDSPSWFKEGEKIGSAVVDGAIKGIEDNGYKLLIAVKLLAEHMVVIAKNTLGIHSPSTIFSGIGKYAVLGFANGLTDNSFLASDAVANLGDNVVVKLQDTISRISEAVSDNIDTQPVIRPVLDLTDVESNAGRINAMFSTAQAMRISADMNTDAAESNQNGGNVDNSKSFNFVQNNYSPKALSNAEIYRQTKNQFAAMKGALK